MEQTNNGIDFSMDVTGPQGGRFTLYPITGIHKHEDILIAKSYMYAQHDVVGKIQVEWKQAASNLSLVPLPEPEEFSSVRTSESVLCELCTMRVKPGDSCPQTKNGYCEVSRFQAAKNAKEFGMHKPRYQEEKT